ncbi:MAG TPA: Wzz/FepE/Etk N-terminal domain-containing protein [Pseudolabrys sp.]|jgi:uncharacterized protein involved in exopolysaccharide biosynthesis
MNTQLKFDPHGRPNFQLEQSDLRAHYQNVARATLLSIWQHRRLIASFVAAALILASLVIPLMPRKYSAEALVYPNLFVREQGPTKVQALASVDAAALINSEARLIRSDALVRTVVKRLGLDRDSATQSWIAWSVDRVKAWLFPETRNYSPFDRAVATLRNKVSVMNDSRSYLVSISYTASTAEEATRVVNAFATEYLRDKAIQTRQDAVNAAEGQLGRELAIYGEKHPRVMQAVEGLEAARSSLKAAMGPQDGGQDDIVTEEGVKLAVPNRTPTSPKGFMILGLAFLVSLVGGGSLAVWRDRRDAKRKLELGHQPHPQ